MAFFVCPNCSHIHDAPDAYVGRNAKGLKCQTRGEITKSKPKPPPPLAPVPQPIAKTPIKKTDLPSSSSVPHTYGVIVILLSAMLVAQLFGLTSTKTSTTQWEYTVKSPSDSELSSALERLGDQGWELVFARRASSSADFSYEMIFKRPKR